MSKVTQLISGVAGIPTQLRFSVYIVYYYGIQENKHVNKEINERISGADNGEH